MTHHLPDRTGRKWPLPAMAGPTNRAAKVSVMSAVVAAAVVSTPAAALAEERVLAFDVGLGAQYAPEYEGSDEYTVGPTGSLSLSRLSFGAMDFSSDPAKTGFSLSPSFRYLAERNSDDFAELAGIPTNDAAIELGLRAAYDWERFRVFGQVRKGVTGHSGIAGEAGADVKFDLSDTTKFSLGPRVSFGDDTYMSYAFDVPTSATALPAFDAGGGIKSWGIEARLRHEINDRTFVDGILSWERFSGDASDSPIVQAGDDNQFRIGVTLVRRFQIRF